MKKSFKLIVATIFASLSVGAAVGAIVSKSDVKDYEAALAGDTWYYLGKNGHKNATDWSWATGDYTIEQGVKAIWTIRRSEAFKVASKADWSGINLGYSNLSGTDYTTYFESDGDGNIVCKASGVFTVNVASTSSIVIEPVSASDVSSSGKIYRFTNNLNWSKVYVHAWGSSDETNNTEWDKNIELTHFSYNENGEKVYYFFTHVTDYSSLIFRNGSDGNANQTVDISLSYGDVAWFCEGTYDSKQNVTAWTPGNHDYYFYDYENAYNWDVRVYAWSSNGGFPSNASYAEAPAISAAANSSGRVYYFSLPCEYDYVIFKNADDSVKSADIAIHTYAGKAFVRWSSSSTDNKTYESTMAHDWVNNTMHLWDYDPNHDDSEGTNACYGTTGKDGYYAYAKSCYSAFNSTIKSDIAAETNYGLAYARLQAWATACGDTVSSSDNVISFSRINTFVGLGSESNDVMIIAIIVSVITLTAVAGFFFFKKKRA